MPPKLLRVAAMRLVVAVEMMMMTAATMTIIIAILSRTTSGPPSRSAHPTPSFVVFHVMKVLVAC